MVSNTVLCAMLASLSVVAAQLSRAHIVVHKVITAPETRNQLVLGKPFTVSYHVLNLGSTPAYNVSVSDDWPTDTFTAVGNSAAFGTWETVQPDANETLSVVLTPLVAGELSSKGATVVYTYKSGEERGEERSVEHSEEEEEDEDDWIEVRSHSTAPGYVRILTADQYAKFDVNAPVTYGVTATAALLLISVAINNWFTVNKQ